MKAILPIALLASAIPAFGADLNFSTLFVRVPAAHIEQTGAPPPEAAPGALVFANEPGGSVCGVAIEFDLESVPHKLTPLARLNLGKVAKVGVQRPGQEATGQRAALHAFAEPDPGSAEELAGSTAVKAGGQTNLYMMDVTKAVSDALARPAGRRTIRLELRLAGLPLHHEVYRLVSDRAPARPILEIASPAGWTNDWERRLQSVLAGPTVYREAFLPMATNRESPLEVRPMFPPKRITEVVVCATGEQLKEGQDWVFEDGRLLLPPGSRAPIQLDSEFFSIARTNKAGVVQVRPTTICLFEGTWYHERQIEVSYEPASRDWSWPPPVSKLDQLPRLKGLIETKKPVTILVYGDSISAGGNASRFQGAPPYQPSYGEMVAWELQRRYGSPVTVMNHSRGGAASSYGASQVESQAACFKPDLAIIAYGMNDRGPNRIEAFKTNLEAIVDTIRQRSPDTELLLVTPMLNNPLQPGGLDPVLRIRDEILQVTRPGLAVVDVTSAHVEMLLHKNYLDLSGNGVNHPNDFLHRVYAQRILEVLIPEP